MLTMCLRPLQVTMTTRGTRCQQLRPPIWTTLLTRPWRLLGRELPTFGIDMNLIMLVFSTPVVFYAGWMFIAGAYHSLRRRVLNMSVLIATGVLAAYIFSVLITILGGETFFEAAAMLVTFVLFGHWMEMRSRRGT